LCTWEQFFAKKCCIRMIDIMQGHWPHGPIITQVERTATVYPKQPIDKTYKDIDLALV